MMPRPPKRQGRVERAQAWSVRGVRRASERESRIRASYHAAESAVREGLMVRIRSQGELRHMHEGGLHGPGGYL